MRIRLVNLLLAALLVLAAARLWTALRAPLPQLPPEPPPPAATEAAPVTPPPQSPSGPGAEGYEAIVARDLFSATRGVIPPAPPAAAKPAPKPPAQPKLTLAGVVIVDGDKSAYLQEGSQEVRPRKVREGDAFAGGTVKLIRPDGIVFLFAGSEITVPLRTPKDAGRLARPGEASPAPVQPAALSPRSAQPAASPGPAGQVRRQPQAVTGVRRAVPAPAEEPFRDEEEAEDEGDLIDDEGLLDDSEIPPDDYEEPPP